MLMIALIPVKAIPNLIPPSKAFVNFTLKHKAIMVKMTVISGAAPRSIIGLKTALANSDFTSAQCLQVTKLYTFDDDRMAIMKKMYPRIVDKEAFFTVIATLTFSSNKDEMNKFVQNYGRR